MLLSSRSSRRGFTLVEIVLALGLIAFALVGIFGLLSAATTTSSSSDRDTMIVSMSAQIMNDLRSVTFDSLWSAEPRGQYQGPSQPAVYTVGTTGSPQPSIYLFTGEGVLIPGKTVTPQTVYYCKVVKIPDDVDTTIPMAERKDTRGYGTTKSEFNLLKLQLQFQWPASAPEANRQTYISYERIARY